MRIARAEQLVSARRHDVGAGAQRGRDVGLVRQQRVRAQQTGSDVGDDGHPEPCEVCHRRFGGEPGDREIRRVHLEHERGAGTHGLLVVRDRGAVRGPDLAKCRTGRGEQIRNAEAVSDLDEFAAADDDLGALVAGQRERAE
jgi:hypothetical protein